MASKQSQKTMSMTSHSSSGSEVSSGATGMTGNLGRQSTIAMRSFLISRVDPSANKSWSSSARRGHSLGSAGGNMMSLSAGVAQQLTQAGITGFRGDRTREKVEMQNLNERLASYIEKVHYLSAENQRLEAENEALRNQKTEDLQPIRDAYENELAQARKVYDELSVQEGVAQAKLQGLNDEIYRLNDIIATYENQAADYRKQVSTATSTIGELEGELSSLRAALLARDGETEKQREIILKYQDQIRSMRTDLDSATAAHIEAECLGQTKAEEASFYKDLLDQLELMKPEPIKIKGMDAAEFWQSHMKKAIRDIQSSCDDKIALIQQDAEAKFTAQVSAMKSGSVKDTMQLASCKEEVTRLRAQLKEKNSDYAQMAQTIAILQSERDQFISQISEMETQMDEMKLKYEGTISSLEAELAGVMAQIKVLMDAKLSMELEIACYKQLLESEETRTTTSMSRSNSSMVSGASMSMVSGGSMSMSGGKSAAVSSSVSGVEGILSSSGGAAGAALAAVRAPEAQVAKMQVQRRAMGAIGFSSIEHSGANVVIENDRSNTQSVNLSGWKVQRSANDKVTTTMEIKDLTLSAGAQYTIWAKGAKSSSTTDNEMISNDFSFGFGNCVWVLLDKKGNERASLTATFLQ